ncbi:MAG: hypothetical protein AAF514_22895, partial [Verrucomicrobiota bacterium]
MPWKTGLLSLLVAFGMATGAASSEPFLLDLAGDHKVQFGDEPNWMEIGLDDSGWLPLRVPGSWYPQYGVAAGDSG